MKEYIVIPVFIVSFLISACGPAPIVAESAPEVPEVVDEAPATAEEPAPETVAVDCLDGEVSPIAESIAADYDLVSYEQVILWFCNGAEYEDILVALETETLTDSSVEEMLKMLADGFTWDEIWLSVGLIE